MSNLIEKRVSAADEDDFRMMIAVFAYGSYLEHGNGGVIIRTQHFFMTLDGKIHANLLYATPDSGGHLIPPEAAEMVEGYLPESEAVVAIVGDYRCERCFYLMPDAIPCKPVFAWARGQKWHVEFDPGTILLLNESIGDIQPGEFVFLREEKAIMKLAKPGVEDGDGILVATDERCDVHVDYRDLFEPLPVNIFMD